MQHGREKICDTVVIEQTHISHPHACAKLQPDLFHICVFMTHRGLIQRFVCVMCGGQIVLIALLLY